MGVIVAIIVIVVIIALAFGVWSYMGKRKSDQLRDRFGPEYDRAVSQYGGKKGAEPALLEREERVKSYQIRALSDSDRDGYLRQWRIVQADFVDDPAGAVRRADALVQQVMRSRGYPMNDFEQQAADLSVDHAGVVDNYRSAHDIALKQENGDVTTEDLRQATMHYRALFRDLLEAAAENPAGAQS